MATKLTLLAVLSIFAIVGNAHILQLTRVPNHHRITTHNSRSVGDSISLSGGLSTLGEFYATVAFGTPGQSMLLQVDTGSSDTLVYSASCSGCGTGVGSFTPSSSSTDTVIVCGASGYGCSSCATYSGVDACFFSDSYGSGAVETGPILQDKFSVGIFTGVTVSFGLITTSTGNFEHSPVDGIWGLSYPDLAWFGTPVFNEIVSQKAITNTFSMCLQSTSPVMSMGINYSSTSGFVWTPIVKQQYYNVNLTDFRVGGTSLGYSASTLSTPFGIVDSGTTLILIPNAVYNSFIANLQSRCSTVTLNGFCNAASGQGIFNGYCYSMTSAQISQYPSIQIYFKGITGAMTVTPQMYLYALVSGGNTYYCGGIGNGGSFGTILGDVFMQGWHVVFDRVNNQIGFGATSTCPTTGVHTSH